MTDNKQNSLYNEVEAPQHGAVAPHDFLSDFQLTVEDSFSDFEKKVRRTFKFVLLELLFEHGSSYFYMARRRFERLHMDDLAHSLFKHRAHALLGDLLPPPLPKIARSGRQHNVYRYASTWQCRFRDRTWDIELPAPDELFNLDFTVGYSAAACETLHLARQRLAIHQEMLTVFGAVPDIPDPMDVFHYTPLKDIYRDARLGLLPSWNGIQRARLDDEDLQLSTFVEGGRLLGQDEPEEKSELPPGFEPLTEEEQLIFFVNSDASYEVRSARTGTPCSSRRASVDFPEEVGDKIDQMLAQIERAEDLVEDVPGPPIWDVEGERLIVAILSSIQGDTESVLAQYQFEDVDWRNPTSVGRRREWDGSLVNQFSTIWDSAKFWLNGAISFDAALSLVCVAMYNIFFLMMPWITFISMFLCMWSPLAALWFISWINGAALRSIYTDLGSPLMFATLLGECFSLAVGFPFGLFIVLSYMPAAGEERVKRYLNWHFGWIGVLSFAFVEFGLYVAMLGPQAIVIRLMVVWLHVFWAMLPRPVGELLHGLHNGLSFAISVFIMQGIGASTGDFTSLLFRQDYTAQFDNIAGNIGMLVVASFSVVLVMAVLLCIQIDRDARPTDVIPQSRKTSARDFSVVHGKLFKGDIEVRKFPPLFTFSEWERAKQEGLVDLLTMADGWAPDGLKLYYLACVVYMKQGGVASYRRALTLGIIVLKEEKKLFHDDAKRLRQLSSYQSRYDDVVPQAGISTDGAIFGVDRTHLNGLKAFGKPGSMLVRLVWLASQETPIHGWAICFSREIVELGFDEDFFDWLGDHSESALSSFAEWLNPPEVVKQSASEFLDSPLYVTFMKLIQNLLVSTFLEEKLGMDVLTIKKFDSFGTFLRDVVKFLSMSKEAIICWLTGKKCSVYLGSFTGTEVEIDILLKAPMPDPAQKDFTARRAERLQQLEGMSEALRVMSVGKPELTMRHLAIQSNIAEVRRIAFADQLGEEPVVYMFLGTAGLGKSTMLTELSRACLTQSGRVPDGGKPENVTYIMRLMGNKHIDALPNPGAVKALLMDDFQQVVSIQESRVIELALFHAMSTAESVPLPYASIELKAMAADLRPDFFMLATNRIVEVFAGAREFNRDSLARRVDLAIDVSPTTSVTKFSASRPPGRYDVMFTFYTLEYTDEGNDAPTRIPALVEGIFRTSDRLQAMGLLTRYGVALRERKDEMMKIRKSGVRCTHSAWGIQAHYGTRCHENCSFTMLAPHTPPPLPVVLMKRREDATGWVDLPSSYLERINGHWVNWNRLELELDGRLYVVDDAAMKVNPAGTFDRYGVRPAQVVEHMQPIPQSASPASVQAFGVLSVACTALILPDFWRWILVVGFLVFLAWLYARRLSRVQRFQVQLYVVFWELIPEWWDLAMHRTEEYRVNRLERIREVGQRYAPGASGAVQHLRGLLHLRVQNRVETKVANVVSLAGVVMAMGVAYYWWKRPSKTIVAQASSNMPSGDNELIKCDPELRKQAIKMYRKVPQGQWAQTLPVIVGSIARMSVGRGLTTDYKAYALVSGNRAFTVSHAYSPTMNFRPIINTGDEEKGQRLRLTYVEGANGVVRFPGTDVIRVELGENPRRNIDAHFVALETLREVIGEAYLILDNIVHTVKIVSRVEKYLFQDGSPSGTIISEAFEYELPFDTYVGLCGALIVGKSSNGCLFIIGIHHAGLESNARKGLGQYLPAEFLGTDDTMPSPIKVVPQVIGAIKQSSAWTFNDLENESDLPPLVDVSGSTSLFQQSEGWRIGEDFEYTDCKEKGTTSYLGIGAYRIGTLAGPQRRQTTHLRESVFAPYYPEGGKEHYAPAWFKEVEVDGVRKGPYSKLAEARAKDLDIYTDALARAREDLRLSDEVLLDEMKGMTPLSIRQAINGISGFMNPMNLATSAGFGRAGKRKSDYIKKVDGDVFLDEVLHQELEKLVNEPAVYDLPVEGCEKDEIRPIEKADATRFFTIFPTAFLIFARMFISWIMSIWRRDPVRAETMIGQNAAGKAWSILGESLDCDWEHDSWFLAVDFKKYDKSFSSVLKSAVYSHIMNFVRATAYTPGQVQCCLCLFGMLMNTFLILKKDIFHIWDWQHSGDPFTVEVNSFGQRLLYRYWFFKCVPEAKPGDFVKWVSLWTYGDDGLARVRRDSRLSVLSFVEAIADWGMEATSSAKGALDECPRDMLSFLKRAIVHDEEFGGYRAPLEEASIYKMLCWFDTTSAITEGTWASAVSDNAAAEWFLHGRDRFEIETARLKKACDDAGVVYAGREWDVYMARYVSSTFVTWAM